VCDSIIEKSPGCWQKLASVWRVSVEVFNQKMSSVSSRSVQGFSQNLRQCADEVRRVEPKTVIRILGKWQGSSQKIALLCRLRVGRGTKKRSQCAREVSRWAAKNGVRVQAKFRRWHTKDVSVHEKCMASAKNCVSVQAKCHNWHPKKG
jgi:hypothetical protein